MIYLPDNANLSYTADDLMSYYTNKDIQLLLLVNPDNPSGNFISQQDLLRLVEWSEQHSIRLVVDESFVDLRKVDCIVLYCQIIFLSDIPI